MRLWPQWCFVVATAALVTNTTWARAQTATTSTLTETVSSTESRDFALETTTTATTPAESVSAYCDSILQDFYSTYIATEIATSLRPGYDGYGPTDSNGILTGSVTSQSYWTSTYTYTQIPIRAYTAKPPCCSQCYLSAGTVQLIYWTDQASASTPAPGTTSTRVNSDGFIFTSPSVYIAVSTLYASNKCGIVGEVWNKTTLAFAPDEITTLNPTQTRTYFRTASMSGTLRTLTEYSTTKPPDAAIDYAAMGTNCSQGGAYTYWPGNPFNAGNGAAIKDPCHPILLLPTRLLHTQSAWRVADCRANPGSEGFYDPPMVLVTASAFETPTLTNPAVTALPTRESAMLAGSTSGGAASKTAETSASPTAPTPPSTADVTRQTTSPSATPTRSTSGQSGPRLPPGLLWALHAAIFTYYYHACT